MPDAARTPPRRWNVELDGIRWLPRLIDKARMSRSGSLGAYLFGHSPVDHELLRLLGVTTDEFADIVHAAPEDASVLDELRRRGFDEARVRRWSDRLPSAARYYIWLWDLDDGYVRPSGAAWLLFFAMRATEGPIFAMLRRFLRKP